LPYAIRSQDQVELPILRSRQERVDVARWSLHEREKPIADNARWTRRPEGSTWGDFGLDDEKGRLNLLTPAKVLQGIAEVKVGKTFCLSLPLDYAGGAILSPRRVPPVLRPTMRGDKPNMNYPLRCDGPTATDVVCDDQVILSLQYSTQWDSLAHGGQQILFTGPPLRLPGAVGSPATPVATI
jgi:hypothetical protein